MEHDLFNNGLGNKRQQFKRIFGWSVVKDTGMQSDDLESLGR